MFEIIENGGNLILKNVSSFDLSQTLDCGQAFRFIYDGEFWHGNALGVDLKMKQDGESITFFDMTKAEFTEKFYSYFTLDIDYDALKLRFQEDENLKKAIDFAGGIRLLRQDKWECLCSFIISQNNNIPRIRGIINRLCEHFDKFPTANDLQSFAPDDLGFLRAGFRAKYIIDAAQKVACGEVRLSCLPDMDYEDAKAELMKIKGVGPKVADCVLLFSCEHFEAFPKDVWINRVMSEMYPQGLPECMGKYAGVAQQYLFHYIRNNSDK